MVVDAIRSYTDDACIGTQHEENKHGGRQPPQHRRHVSRLVAQSHIGPVSCLVFSEIFEFDDMLIQN